LIERLTRMGLRDCLGPYRPCQLYFFCTFAQLLPAAQARIIISGKSAAAPSLLSLQSENRCATGISLAGAALNRRAYRGMRRQPVQQRSCGSAGLAEHCAGFGECARWGGATFRRQRDRVGQSKRKLVREWRCGWQRQQRNDQCRRDLYRSGKPAAFQRHHHYRHGRGGCCGQRHQRCDLVESHAEHRQSQPGELHRGRVHAYD
jgi:hypothetical protein